MNLEKKLEVFSKLGRLFKTVFSEKENEYAVLLAGKAQEAFLYNPWFTNAFVEKAFFALSDMLDEKKLSDWAHRYLNDETPLKCKNIAVICAGNIPMAGFHDMLCVLISGNRFIGKLSSKDNILLPAIAEIICIMEPGFRNYISFESGSIKGMDAVIASGSDNTATYFNYYFGKYPHIIRKHKTSVAVLTGNETDSELESLADDIFIYFGLGCRNVSKLFLPEGYDPSNLFQFFKAYFYLYQHNKYVNNYEYQRVLLLMNRINHLDNGILLLTENKQLFSPVGVLYYEFYKEFSNLAQWLHECRDQIQCIVSKEKKIQGSVKFGQTQSPAVDEYADGIDTVRFLMEL